MQGPPGSAVDSRLDLSDLASAPADQGTESPESDLGAPSLEAACEAILLLAEHPVSIETLATIVARPTGQIHAVVTSLAAQYQAQRRGFALREAGGGWRFYTSADCQAVVSRYVVDGQHPRLTQAALETLAIVAYRQPVSRAQIGAVRAVNVDGVVRTLLSRGLIEEAGLEQGSQAILLRTTPYFLERLGLATITDLPAIAEHVPSYRDLGELVDFA